MTTFSWPLQQSIVTMLSGFSPALAGGRIYDVAPQTVVFPYVEIGEGQIIPDDTTLADEGTSEFVTIHIWSRYRGMKEVKLIGSEISSLLHNQSLTVAGRASAHAWVRSFQMVRDPDGLSQHGIMTVEVIHRSN